CAAWPAGARACNGTNSPLPLQVLSNEDEAERGSVLGKNDSNQRAATEEEVYPFKPSRPVAFGRQQEQAAPSSASARLANTPGGCGEHREELAAALNNGGGQRLNTGARSSAGRPLCPARPSAKVRGCGRIFRNPVAPRSRTSGPLYVGPATSPPPAPPLRT
ncbi:unnamed protein product, partial [Amoebophrya sp. A120]